MDHEAIYKAYPDCVEIYEDKGAFKSDGTKIDPVQSDIDAARSLHLELGLHILLQLNLNIQNHHNYTNEGS